MASGIVQSLLQAASTQLGERGAPAFWILGLGTLVGSLWGLLQLHMLAGMLWLVSRDPAGARVPFARIRTAIALAYTPLGAAVLAWFLGTIVIGRWLYADPTVLASVAGPGAALEVSLLYLATLVCIGWSLVLHVVAVAEVRECSMLSAVGTYVAAFLVTFVAMLVLVLVLVAVIR